MQQLIFLPTLKKIAKYMGFFEYLRTSYHQWLWERQKKNINKTLLSLRPFDNPFNVSQPETLDKYEDAAARSISNQPFIDYVYSTTGYLAPSSFVNSLGRLTKVGLNYGISRPTFDSAYVLYGLVRRYGAKASVSSVSVLEVGTSHGFSSLIMAKALDDNGGGGKVVSLDPIPVGKEIFWNTISDVEGPKNIRQALNEFGDLIDKYMVYIRGFSQLTLETLFMPKVDVAFVDGAHQYLPARHDLYKIAAMQVEGNLLIADDYSPTCPGVIKAVDEILLDFLYRPLELFQIENVEGVTIALYALERTNVPAREK